jgi:hypothetical protein
MFFKWPDAFIPKEELCPLTGFLSPTLPSPPSTHVIFSTHEGAVLGFVGRRDVSDYRDVF